MRRLLRHRTASASDHAQTNTYTNTNTNTTPQSTLTSTKRPVRRQRRRITAVLLTFTVTLSTAAASFQCCPTVSAVPHRAKHRFTTLSVSSVTADQPTATSTASTSTPAVLAAAAAAVPSTTTTTTTSSSNALPNERQPAQRHSVLKHLFRKKYPAALIKQRRHHEKKHAHKKAPAECKQQIDYQRRKQEWASKYTSVEALRRTFGSNSNVLWGDLDAGTARRLYKTLLPRALLELHQMGVHPTDLAPLAYQARVAAKLYARERCVVPARVAAEVYDGFRQWRRYGSFQTAGMSYQQVWNKYAADVMDTAAAAQSSNGESLTETDVTAQICLKILERSCQTNEMIDKLVLSKDKDDTVAEQRRDLQEVTDTLERDVRRLLLSSGGEGRDGSAAGTATARTVKRFRMLRILARSKKRFERLQRLHQGEDAETCETESHTSDLATHDDDTHADYGLKEKAHISKKSHTHKLPWKNRPQQTTNRQKNWVQRDPPTRRL